MNLKILTPQSLFLIQILATAMMTGIIWFVQVAHYPLFEKIPKEGFVAYEICNTTRTGWVVAPIMLVELGSAFLLMVLGSRLGYNPLHLIALGCLLLIWLSTFFIQVPLHGILRHRADISTMEQLVSGNWIRTVLWSLRLLILSVMIAMGKIF